METLSMVDVKSGCSHRQAIWRCTDYQLSSIPKCCRISTHQVWQQTQTPQIPHTSLSRLGLLLSTNNDDQTDVDQGEVLVADPELELSHRFDERCRFNVTDGST
jgi:hypothetical protein